MSGKLDYEDSDAFFSMRRTFWEDSRAEVSPEKKEEDRTAQVAKITKHR